jgi:hypothetical protein
MEVSNISLYQNALSVCRAAQVGQKGMLKQMDSVPSAVRCDRVKTGIKMTGC